jgi:pimeloyl-ACP methyl ester carboxylesterase
MRQDQRGAPTATEVVILVHGLWLGGWVCRLLGHRLHGEDFRVKYFSYPSMRDSLSANAARLTRFARSIDAPTLHFVGHSLGGLVVARSQIDHPDPRPGRVVLLGSPFAGSNAAARLESSRIGAALLGRSIREWLLDRPQAWSGPRELGVIAGCGRIGMGRIIAPDLARPNDGVVAVAETRVPGAADHLVLPVSHTAMLASRRVAEESAHFLRNGRFRHEAEDERREKLGQALPEQQ